MAMHPSFTIEPWLHAGVLLVICPRGNQVWTGY
jgi:hypothetical protein